MNKPCKGTIYKVGGKYYCVGEKMIKKENGKTVNIWLSKKKSKKSKKNKSKKNKSKKNKTKKNK